MSIIQMREHIKKNWGCWEVLKYACADRIADMIAQEVADERIREAFEKGQFHVVEGDVRDYIGPMEEIVKNEPHYFTS